MVLEAAALQGGLVLAEVCALLAASLFVCHFTSSYLPETKIFKLFKGMHLTHEMPIII